MLETSSNVTGAYEYSSKGVNEDGKPLCSSACPGCPVCESPDSTSKFTIPDFLHGVPGAYTYVECRSCGTVYQNPRDHRGRPSPLLSADLLYPLDCGIERRTCLAALQAGEDKSEARY